MHYLVLERYIIVSVVLIELYEIFKKLYYCIIIVLVFP